MIRSRWDGREVNPVRVSRAGCIFHAASGFVIGVLAVCGNSSLARSDEADDSGTAKTQPTLPNIYLDASTVYSAVPANTLAIGFRNLASLSTTSSQNLALNAPLTIDLTDRLSVNGGVTANTSRTVDSSWTSLTLTNWTFGFTADVIEKHAAIPTVTVQANLSRPIGSSALAATTAATVVELNYGLNDDDTKGLLGGVKLTSVFPDSPIIKIEPVVVGYAGAYYQWPDNWKLTGRLGVQTFGGAQLGRPVQVKAFTQPIAKLDLDRMDDNDNRLFGLSIEVAWVPRPLVQFTLSTPLYLVRN